MQPRVLCYEEPHLLTLFKLLFYRNIFSVLFPLLSTKKTQTEEQTHRQKPLYK